MGAAMNLFGLRKDGTEFPVDIMLKPIRPPSGPVVLSFVRDVTEQRAAHGGAAPQRPAASLDCGERSRLRHLPARPRWPCVMTWNPGAERIKGYPAEEILGLHFSRFFTQEDVDRGRPAELLRLAAERGRVEEEGWRVRKDGSRFWADSMSSPPSATICRRNHRLRQGDARLYRPQARGRSGDAAVEQRAAGQYGCAQAAGSHLGKHREVIPHDAPPWPSMIPPPAGWWCSSWAGRGGRFRGAVRLPMEGSPAGQAFRTREPV
jgi:formate hydrogenlyase transcriptional activator